jgi:hypothetical protein
MEGKVKTKLRPKSAQREVMHLSQRNIIDGIDFCKKERHCGDIKYLHCSSKRRFQIKNDPEWLYQNAATI